MNLLWNILFCSKAEALEVFYPIPIHEFLAYLFVSLFLTLLGGLMSGLTVGLLSIDV